MAEKQMLHRLTLFPPSGKRIIGLIRSYRYESGMLHYADMEGISYHTTLPYAIEDIEEGHKKEPFNDRSE